MNYKLNYFGTFLILFLLPGLLVAQSQQLKTYYQHIHKAENFILDKQYDSSHIYFEAAFSLRNEPFARHVYNAAIVTMYLNDYAKTEKYLRFLIERGASVTRLSKKEALQPFFVSQTGKKFLSTATHIKPVYNYAYRAALAELLRRDQQYRVLPGAYTKHRQAILKIDSQNIQQFLGMVKRYGFPTESKIGIDTTESFAPAYFPILMIHQGGGFMQQYNFSPLLKDAIFDGEIDNELGNYLTNLANSFYAYHVTRVQLVRVKDKNRSASDPSNYDLLDSTNWGFFPLTPAEQQNLYSLQDNTFQFGSIASNASMIITSREELDRLRKIIITDYRTTRMPMLQ
jgi:hypothetical protein